MDAERLAVYVKDLEGGELHAFSEWSLAAVPGGPPGVYTIWHDAELLYVGMSYRDATETANPQARGLAGRLNSHASGRRSGDQFNIYICDRFVLRTLTSDEMDQVCDGRLKLDLRTREHIREHLTYRFVLTPTGDDARVVERHIRQRGLPEAGKPKLNPL